jgi:TPR repeat protein
MGVEEDRTQAVAWLSKAAAQRFQPAKDALARLAAQPKESKP